MRVVVQSGEEYINIEGDRLLEGQNGFIYAYCGDELVGAFDLGTLDKIYRSEEKKKEEDMKWKR